MRTRPITALLAALALLAVICAASFAQTPTPTATAAQDDGTAADPPADASKEVKAVYTDYSRDGVIDVCDHTRAVLQETLDGIEAEFDRDFPDFREAVKAGIQRHDKRQVRRRRGHRDGDGHRRPRRPPPTPTATASPDDGALPPATDDGRPTRRTTARSRPRPTTARARPRGRRAPARDREGRRADAGPDRRPPTVATTPPSPTPAVVTRSSTDGLLSRDPRRDRAARRRGLTLAAISGRSPRTRHAFSEAAYRFKGTWADFSDWLKLGR